MNVTTRQEFDLFLTDMRNTKIRVFDTETNGLKMYRDNFMISMSVYLPEVDRSYNLAFFNGDGEVEINYTKDNTPETPFHKNNWQGRTKKQLFLSYWFEQFRRHMMEAHVNGDYLNYFENLPYAWLNEIKEVWGRGVYIGHNTRFDAHVLYQSGFPDMETVYDTMITLHIVSEDWRGCKYVAPYKYTAKDVTNKIVPEHMVGLWAVDGEGKLLTKEQNGNRGLKWQAAFHGFENAAAGEQGLSIARIEFEEVLANFIAGHWDDPMNVSLVTKKQRTALESSEGFPTEGKALEAHLAVRDKIRNKIELDDKANMWMLPAGKVAYYAELDVILTWKLYQWCMPIIQEWKNEGLFETQSAIHHRVAWEMERNGFKLDVAQAEAEIAKLTPRITEIEEIVADVASGWIDLGDEEFNVASPKQLLPFLNSGVLGADFGKDLFPEWWPESQSLELKVYPNIRLAEHDLEEQYDALEGTAKEDLYKVQDHPLIRLVKQHRMMKKSVTTYLEKWLAARDDSNTVRFSINDDGTVSGRTSSSGDAGNGQNIPDRNGYTIKRAIVVPDDNWVLVAVDYSTLELRLAAWIAEGMLGLDPKMTMTNLFLSGADMHSWVRDEMKIREILYHGMTDEQIVSYLGYSLDDPKYATPEKQAAAVAKRCRDVAKTLNFGLLYSGGYPMVVKLLRLDVDTAKLLVNKWRNLFPAFPKAQKYFTELALTRRPNPSGTNWAMYATQPISGRSRKIHRYSTSARYFSDGEWLTYNPQESAARKVWNNTVQGLGGFICMESALRIGDELGRDKIRMFAQIHDALEMYVHKNHLHLLPKLMEIMNDYPQIVPNLGVVASASTSGTWQDMTEIIQMCKWLATTGKEGYYMNDHYGREYYQWDATVTHNGVEMADTAVGIDPKDARKDLEMQANAAFPGEAITVTIHNRDQWKKY